MIAVLAVSCGGTGSAATTEAPDSSPTTIAADHEAQVDDTCVRLKAAVFDLREGLAEATADPGSPEDETVRAFSGLLTTFYTAVGSVAESAPADIGSDLATLAESAGAISTTLAGADTLVSVPAHLEEEAEPTMIEAARKMAAWTEWECGGELLLAPADAVGDAVATAALVRDGTDDPWFADTTAISAVAYGDDSELDALWDGCADGDGDACSNLYWASIGAYELFGRTCGGRTALRSLVGVDCATKLDADGPSARGDDAHLDLLWHECEGGDDEACDELYSAAPFGSGYEALALSCGGRYEAEDARPCVFSDSGQAFGYGDDSDLDGLWDACSIGSLEACQGVFFESPIGSAYEAFGQACTHLTERELRCALPAEWLRGPVG